MENINIEIYRNYLGRYTHWINTAQHFYKKLCDKILDYIHQKNRYKNNNIFSIKYEELLKDKHSTKISFDKIHFNQKFCHDVHYKKYLDMLWQDICKTINEVFEK